MQENTMPLNGTEPDSAQSVRVWDPLVRILHWTTAIGVLIAFLAEDLRDLHKTAGYVVMGALGIRIIWGFLGTPHARFTDFVPGPRQLWNYGKSVVRFREVRHLGHNPAGGAMVLALMISLALVSVTGWMMTLDPFWGEDWVEDLHEAGANAMLILIPLHIGGVLWSSFRHRENLIKAMFTGDKPASDNE